MRTINSDISERLSRNIQTRENNANPSATIWVTRAETALVNEDFLERQDILEGNVTDVSIAACHPVKNLGDSELYIGYISNNKARILRSKTKTNILAHLWEPVEFEEVATAISIAFDGKMASSINDKVEIITEDDPWVFWINRGNLKAQKINTPTVVDLSSDIEGSSTGQCTDVSAIRAVWGLNGSFDFGLVVFFILKNQIYYRQLINGVWTNAEVVSFGPSGVSWSKISAFRTWDYRIGIQAQTTTGDIYELFTQFMGIGKRNTEHINVSNIEAKSELKELRYRDSRSKHEHIEVIGIASNTPYGGLYSTATPEIVSVYNKDDGNGDWGRYVAVIFNNHIKADSLESNITNFTIVDSNGNTYLPMSAELDSTGKTVIFDFTNLHSASTECMFSYKKGTVLSMADVELPDCGFVFVLKNLDGSEVTSAPEPVYIWNTDSDGTEIAIRFSSPVTGDVSGNESNFTVTIQEYNYVPNGTISSSVKTVTNVSNDYCSAEEEINLSSGEFTHITYTNSGIKLEVDE